MSGSPVRLRFTVTDDGPGIPPESMRSIFDPFAGGQAGEQKFGLNLLGVFFLVYHYGGTVKAATGSAGKGGAYSVELPVISGSPVSPEISSEEFVTKVLVNDALWEKLLAGI
jgi:C4-dicarboxylate-specific signal transduction histidine kinase